MISQRDYDSIGDKGWKALTEKEQRKNSRASHRFDSAEGAPLLANIQPHQGTMYQVTVFAQEGDSYTVPIMTRCGSGRFIARKKWQGTMMRAPHFTLNSRGRVTLDTLLHESGYYSLEWAFLEGEIRRGAARQSESWRWTKASMRQHEFGPYDPAGTLMRIRIQQLRVDGSEAHWVGWVAVDTKGHLRQGKGLPPKRLETAFSAEVRCPSPSTFKVPLGPNFREHAPEIVEDIDGVPVPTSRKGKSFLVEAKPGRPFRMEYKPRSTCPEWYEVAKDAMPTFVFAPEVIVYGAASGHIFEFPGVDANRRWPPMKIKWSLTLDDLSSAQASIPRRRGLSTAFDSYIFLSKIPEDFYVEVEPQWKQLDARVTTRVHVLVDKSGPEWRATFTAIP